MDYCWCVHWNTDTDNTGTALTEHTECIWHIDTDLSEYTDRPTPTALDLHQFSFSSRSGELLKTISDLNWSAFSYSSFERN